MKALLWLSLLLLALLPAAAAAEDIPKNAITLDALRAKYVDKAGRIAKIDGVDIYYKDEGQGPAILLVHGSISSLKTWDGVAAQLTKRYRVIRYDVPPQGLSGPVSDEVAARLKPVDIAEGLLKQLGVTKLTAAVGVSSGGTLVSFLAAKRPELVERLIISNAPADPVTTAHQTLTPEFEAAMREAKEAGFRSQKFWSAFLDFYAGDPSRYDAKFREQIYDMNRREPEKNLISLVAQVADHAKTVETLSRVTAPTLLIWGARDQLLPAAAADTLARYLTGAQISKLILPDVGHYPPMEIPDRYAQLVSAYIEAVLPSPPVAATAPRLSITDVSKFQPEEAVPGAGPAPLPIAANAATQLDPAAWQKMRAYSDAHGGVGLIALVDGQVVGEAYRPGTDAQTRTLSQSMHKSVLSLAYGAAIRDHIIESVDDPVGRYVREWQGDPRGAIALRYFLTMSSGLKNYSMAKREPPSIELVSGHDIDAVALATPKLGGPGTEFAYKNVDAQIAGIALERAVKAKTGMRYAVWLSEVLWRPLGNGPASVWLDREGGSPHYFAWLETDLRSWARVGELIRNQGRVGEQQVLPAAWIAQATAPSSANPGYGFFIWRGTPWSAQRRYAADNPITAAHSAPYAVDDIVFFDGFGGQRVYVSPSRHLVIARTGETDMAFDDATLPNLALAGLKLQAP